ncbi:hypothetical protein MJG53_015648 [Ovis ammon polii x Ovis aries]|uniref:Uncharacterized protein n=1 Tax=Ovis ammon polii x Ovis aries TaxID=2918886 RepID=A0ACB9UFN2_9CETA|nr:hypothetical protein MJG53_015648 [Ovis ammon polii x Ovis aries]
MADEKPKEGVKTENNDHINLKVAGQDGSVVQFKIKRHTPLSKLMKAYCERQGLSMRQIRFRFDGQPINETDTPAQWHAHQLLSLYSSAKSSGGREDSESSGPQRRNSSEANSGDFLDLKGEGDVHENMDTDLQATLGQSEEKPVPAAPVPSPVAPAPVPSRRNPPGGKSSLVLG